MSSLGMFRKWRAGLANSSAGAAPQNFAVASTDVPDTLGIGGMFRVYDQSNVMIDGLASWNYLRGCIVLVLSDILDTHGNPVQKGIYGCNASALSSEVPQFPETQQATQPAKWHFLVYPPELIYKCDAGRYVHASAPFT